jgi:hypothetical protein
MSSSFLAIILLNSKHESSAQTNNRLSKIVFNELFRIFKSYLDTQFEIELIRIDDI